MYSNFLELTITSPYLIVGSEVQPSTLTTTNADECFPNYSKMEQPIGKGRVQEKERKRWEVTSFHRHFIELVHWASSCLSWLLPDVTAVRGLRICALGNLSAANLDSHTRGLWIYIEGNWGPIHPSSRHHPRKDVFELRPTLPSSLHGPPKRLQQQRVGVLPVRCAQQLSQLYKLSAVVLV